MDDLDIGGSFGDYCIVCDRAIAPLKEKEKEVKTGKKKVAGGTIRVKNPDGTVMIRNANGTKVTRPQLKRGPNSATRLALAVANNTAAGKLQPLTRSKTTGTDVDTTTGEANELSAKSDSPESVALKTPKTPNMPTDNFISTIYCSRSCAQQDNDRSNDFARRLSGEISPGLHLVTAGLPLSGSSKSPCNSPSPLCISGSDTSSNADPISAGPGASSVPKSFFAFGREGPDDAWNAVNRERRSSIHPAVRPVAMAREPSQASYYSIGPSSDSLNSLWNDHEMDRSSSSSSHIRFTPVSSAIPVRPAPRQSASNASLAASPRPVAIPAEFGSAPEHTFDLWNSYHNSFAKRDSSGTSVSRGGATPTTSPPISTSRRPSYSLSRVSGTIRVNKSHTNVTWDSFGQEELRAKERRASMKAPATTFGVEAHGSTPKQSIEVGKNGCQIKYYQPGSSPSPFLGASPRPGNPRRTSARSVQSVRSDSSASDHEQYHSQTARTSALQIPRNDISLSSSNGSSARTPTTRMLPCSAVPTRPTASPVNGQAMPDLAALRVGSGGCAPSTGNSAPRSTWNWAEFEKKGGKTYEVPPGLKAHAGKSGLFYFGQ